MWQQRFAALGLIALGLGTAAAALLGPLGAGVIDWRISGDMENQLIGGDIVGLVLVAPLALAAGLFWWRAHPLGPLLALGPCLYAVYTYLVAILTPDYVRYAGNSEVFFPLFLGMLILGWMIAALAWSRIAPDALPQMTRRERRQLAAPLIGVAGLLGLAWVGQVTTVMRGDTPPSGYLEHATAFWLIRTLDLGFVIPISIITGIGLLRNRAAATRAAYGVAGFLTLLMASVAAMGIAMLWRDSADATIVFPAVLTPAALLMGVLTARLYRAAVTVPPPEQRATFTRIPRDLTQLTEGGH